MQATCTVVTVLVTAAVQVSFILGMLTGILGMLTGILGMSTGIGLLV